MMGNDNKAMESAEGVALLRALQLKEPLERFRNPDYLAPEFFSLKFKMYYRVFGTFLGFGKKLLEFRAPGSYWYVYCRTLFLDGMVREAVNNGIEQLVIMGAGYDTRMYRMQDELNGINCFEIDLPATQQQKVNNLKRIFPKLPENANIVPIDFNTQTLEEVLLANGFRTDQKTLFLWEGVCMYLPQKSVDAVFEFVKNNSAPGSSIAFDYIVEDVISGKDLSGYGCKLTKESAENLGEKLLFGIEPGKSADEMKKRGFDLLVDLSPKDMSEAYLRQEDGEYVGLILEACHLVHAKLA